MNLLNNAAKYTPAPGRIWLTLEYESGAAVLRVKDTGIGIAAESLPHVFDLFYQVDRSFARAEGGLGLGLTLVRRLIEMHGGSVDVRSAGINRGSEFILRIPAWSEPCQTDNLASFETSGIEAATNLRRILVVDDFPHSATTLAKLLRQDGYEVRTAVDGVEALKVAASFQPDVIVLDIAMPRLDGYEVARRIRQQPWGKGTFLIALTGWGQRQDRQRTQEVGFDAHLTKPVNYKTLAGLLSKLAGGEQWQKTWAVP
jgi:CheY-like chemotaxis protein